MDWLKQMQAALDYMENHMEEKIGIEQIAREACSSTFHFQRMFHMLVGTTVGDYMRKRRLTLAAQELASSSIRVIDVALKYGYDSPESFAKAFRKIHGITPTQARAVGVNLKAYPRISFQISLKGDQEMDYRIEEKAAFDIVGKVLHTTCEDNANLREITDFWSASHQDGTVKQIASLTDERMLFGAIYDMVPGKDTISYMIGCRPRAGANLGAYETQTIPASNWAIFTSIGPMPGAIQTLFDRIYQEWFPATGYEHAGTAELEVYTAGNISDEDYRCEVWIPIKKKDE